MLEELAGVVELDVTQYNPFVGVNEEFSYSVSHSDHVALKGVSSVKVEFFASGSLYGSAHGTVVYLIVEIQTCFSFVV